jgi:ATP-binding cassette subfamily B protein
MMQRMGVRAPIMLIGGTVITLMMDKYLSLVMLAMLPFVFGIIFFISKKGIPLYSKVQKSVDRMVRVVREDVQGIRVIKALSKDEYECRRYDQVNKELVKNEKKASITMGAVHPVMSLLMNMGIVTVIAMSVARVQNKLSSPETIIAFMQYFTQISMAMMILTRIFSMCSKSIASAKRIEEVLLSEDELEVKGKDEYPDVERDSIIEFDNVSFSYNHKLNNVEGLQFKLKKGETLGIIGATGSGKSTLVKLLLRFYDVANGNIRIFGEDIRTIEKERLYGMFGVALQNDFLYADSILENIKFGRELTDEQIEEAARIAQAHDFISSFEGGYQYKLAQKGTNVSGGQKQRILISRAIAAKPDILILDDSSSALDYKTEANLRRELKEKMAGTTIITVAQRVSAVKSCDLIIVMDEGHIIGMGTHDQLLESCIEYKEISDSQMGGAFVE